MILEDTNTTKEIGMYENSSIFEKNDGFDGYVEMCFTKCYSAISEHSLRRSGLRQDGTFGLIDDLALSYDGNRLSSVEEKAAPVLSAATLDLKRGSDEFAYDANGALTMDGTRGITNITYDYAAFASTSSWRVYPSHASSTSLSTSCST